MSEPKNIIIKNARVNNLKNVSLKIPRNEFVVISGVSGSGKSSLAFDTIFAEGQRKYIESLSSYARQFLLGTLFSGSGVVRWFARIVPPVIANRVSQYQAMQSHGQDVPPTCCRTSSRIGEYQQFRVLREVKASTALLYRLRRYHRNIGPSRPRGILALSAFLQTRSETRRH